jgi:KDO2-lipid IV(A) lauroyltransferase
MKKEFLKPKYWGIWIGVGLANLFVLLPYKLQLFIGQSLGRVAYPFLKRRKEITLINLKLCFPEKSDEERIEIAKRSFEGMGMAMVETGIAWFMSDERFARIPVRIQRTEFTKLCNNNESILACGGHFTPMEVIGRAIGTTFPGKFHLVYQPHKNPLMEYLQTKYRGRYATQVPRKNVRALLKILKTGKVLWYAPDQDFGNEKSSIFVPFFNIPAATLTAATFLVGKSDAVMVPCYFFRDEHYGYELFEGGVWRDFPGETAYDDAVRYNHFLEWAIRQKPEDYLWQHRRFKTRPGDEERFY